MPTESYTLDEDMAELCGIISGDGNIWTNNRKYEVSITGCPKDKGYLDEVADYISCSVKSGIYYRVRGRGLRLSIYSKAFYKFLISNVGFGSGTEKNAFGIPKIIRESPGLGRAFIRGLFDTDGSVFTSKKAGAEDYPTIEITNENLILLVQVRSILMENGFRVTFRKSNSETYKIALHGKAMVRKWLELIGSTHPRKRRKMESIIKSIDYPYVKPQ